MLPNLLSSLAISGFPPRLCRGFVVLKIQSLYVQQTRLLVEVLVLPCCVALRLLQQRSFQIFIVFVHFLSSSPLNMHRWALTRTFCATTRHSVVYTGIGVCKKFIS